MAAVSAVMDPDLVLPKDGTSRVVSARQISRRSWMCLVLEDRENTKLGDAVAHKKVLIVLARGLDARFRKWIDLSSGVHGGSVDPV